MTSPNLKGMPLYVSTSCLDHCQGLSKMLSSFEKLGIRDIEIGVWQKDEKGLERFLKNHNLHFIVHQYFPPPEKPFNVNLASPSKGILKESVAQIKKSIGFCSDFGINFFSFHAGFRIDPDVSFKFNFNNIPNYERSFGIFKDSMAKIVGYAEKRKVKVAIENNVVSEYNLKDGRNQIFLMAEQGEFERLFREIPSNNLGILLDLGHLKVSANMLNFDRYKFIERLKNKVFAVHIHENNSRIDQHKEVENNSWCFEVINKYFSKKTIPLIMESRYDSVGELVKNKKLIEKEIKNA